MVQINRTWPEKLQRDRAPALGQSSCQWDRAATNGTEQQPLDSAAAMGRPAAKGQRSCKGTEELHRTDEQQGDR
jgi:hypothetical protein